MKNWSFLRVVRIVLGVSLLITGFQTKEFIPFLIAGLFLYQGVMNTGCGSCASSACEIEPKTKL